MQAIRRSNGKKVWTVERRARAAARPRRGQLLLVGGRAPTGASTSAARTATSTRSPSANGKLAWRKRTGNYVYASPAVGKVGSGPPTVYVGSYDGRFYALDARSGRPRWVRTLGKKISGAATIVGDLVFVSDLDMHTTWALGAQTGTTVWKTRRGGFNPVISDGRRIYFAGFTSLFALDHEGRPFDERAGRRREHASRGRRRARERSAARSARRAHGRARRARTPRARARGRAAPRATRARAAARRACRAPRAPAARQRKLRIAPHGHRHTPRKGKPPPRCHRHRHVYKVRGKTIVLVHNHCHTHVRRR